ncbi:glycoside hydrolase family 78 protein [Zalerion maritima]|uniref:Glycoside hydrolase family 78 protein n=1 Tax=Zalerion maritima TaxID=339359 RepID=A0AAD5RI40_9PEZI|nr:glycoside hydrolase family 78 protein [Zalerion maritima]
MTKTDMVDLALPSRAWSAGNCAEPPHPSTRTAASLFPLSLSPENTSIVLDHGRCQGGIPGFEILEARGSGPVTFKVIYSETKDGIDSETVGGGPFFLFSNAMDSYRNLFYTRYQRLVLSTPDSSVKFPRAGFGCVSLESTLKASFQRSNQILNRVWRDGARTVDMCSVRKGETQAAWDVTPMAHACLACIGRHAGKGRDLGVFIRASGDSVSTSINNQEIGVMSGLHIQPILGGEVNSGSVAFGGPEGWTSLYQASVVKDLKGAILYENGLLIPSRDRTLADFQVGTNSVACTIDGAKRDRACFGGDLHVLGRSIAYSTSCLEAVAGSTELLTSHQTSDGYLGNLCPTQAPLHEAGSGIPTPTYAFYSLTYALLLVVAVKDYWMHSGNSAAARKCFPRLERLLHLVEKHRSEELGLIQAPPPLSIHWFPMNGPLFGASGGIHLAYYDALKATQAMAALAGTEKAMGPSSNAAPQGLCQDINAYATWLGVAPWHSDNLARLIGCAEKDHLPVAFQNLGHWDSAKVLSPYATGLAVEALFKHDMGLGAEAMKTDGSPFSHDTSLAHGRSTWPVFLLPEYLAGLKVVEPGWRAFKVRPVLAVIASIDYSLDTQLGEITVGLRYDEVSQTGLISLTAPKESVAEVHAPAGHILVDGPAVITGPVAGLSIKFYGEKSGERKWFVLDELVEAASD